MRSPSVRSIARLRPAHGLWSTFLLFALVTCALALSARDAAATIRFAPATAYASGSGASSVLLAHVSADDFIDVLVTNGGDSTISVHVADGSGGFAPKVDYPVGTNPRTILAIDLNGDGMSDLIVSNSGDNTVSVLMNNGDGTFAPKTDYPTGLAPGALMVSDYTHDSWFDIVVANEGEQTVSLLPGNGDGTFGERVDLAVPGHPTALSGGGITGLEANNIAVACSPNRVVILTGNLSGTFDVGPELIVGNDPSALWVENLNGDGEVDIAVANRGSGTVSVFIGLGGGTFAPRVDYPVGSNPVALSVGDVDGDGFYDIVTADEADGTASILRGHGGGLFQARQVVPLTAQPLGLALGDLNGDNFTDLVTADGAAATMSVYSQAPLVTANIEFLVQPSGIPVGGTIAPPVQVRITDSDGQPVADEPVQVYMEGNGTLSGSPEEVLTGADGIAEFGGLSIDRSGMHTLWALTFAGVTTQSAPFLVSAGPPAALVFVSQPSTVTAGQAITPGVTVFVTDAQQNGVAGVPVTLTLEGGGVLAGGGALATDTEGYATFTALAAAEPGIRRLVASCAPSLQAMSVPFEVLAAPNVAFLPPQTFFLGGRPGRLALGDLNGDGIPDLAVTDYTGDRVVVALGNGDGTYHSPRIFATGNFPIEVQLADMNNDGRKDLLVVNSMQNSFTLWPGLGNGDFGAALTVTSSQVSNGLLVADVNEDGTLDVLRGEALGLAVRLGNGDGTFAAPLSVNPGGYVGSMIARDVNGDGHADLIATLFYSQMVRVMLGTGTGAFGAPITVNSGSSPIDVVAGNLDGDSFVDLAVVNSDSNTVSIIPGHGDGTFGARTVLRTGDWPTAIDAGDLNADGNLDLAIVNTNTSSLTVFTGRGDGTFDPRADFAQGQADHDVVIGDVDGNGSPDLLSARYQNGHVVVLRNQGTLPTATLVELFSAVPTVEGVRIEWRLSDPNAFRSIELQRGTSAAGEWAAVSGSPQSEGATSVVLDTAAPAGSKSWYRLSGVTRAGGAFVYGPIEATAIEAIRELALAPLAPNPSRGRSTVSFDLPSRARVRVTLVDLQGREVARLADETLPAGRHVSLLDASDLRAGMYFVRMQAGGRSFTRRLIVVK